MLTMMKRLSLFCLLLLVLSGVRAGEVVDPVRLRLETLGGITEIRPLKAGEFAAKYELMVFPKSFNLSLLFSIILLIAIAEP